MFFGRLYENTDFSTPTPIILPYHAKNAVLDDLPAFKNELHLSLETIGASDELILFGKQFVNRDIDLCEGIRKACQQKKRVVLYVDPQSSNSDWLLHHDELFNAGNRDDHKRLYRNLSAFLEERAAS